MVVLSLGIAAWAGVEPGVAPPAGLDRAYGSRRVALVVGIDRYDDPALGDLKYAAKDAADVAAVFRDPEVGGYDVVSVAAGEVVRDGFWSAFRAISQVVQRDDTVVVYVAGHGTLDLGPDGTELFLLPSDGALDDPSGTGIRIGDLADAIGDLSARRTVLIVDACYAGTGRSVLPEATKRRIDGLRGPVPAPPALQVSEFSAHLYAAHVHQPAIEDPTLENGVYTHYFVEALRGAGDADGDHLVEALEAHAWARDRTLAYTGGAQVPWAEVVSVGRQVLFLAGDPERRAASEAALLTGLEALASGASVSVDGVARGGGPIPPGRHTVAVADGAGGVLVDESHAMRVGTALDLGDRVSARAARIGVRVGPSGSTDRAWIGAAGVEATVTAWPRDPSGPRPLVALASRVAEGPAGRGIPAGTVTLGVGEALRLARTGLWLAPTVGAGLAWRFADTGPQGSPMVRLGLDLTGAFGPIAVSVGPSASVLAAGGQPVALPAAALGLGVELPSR